MQKYNNTPRGKKRNPDAFSDAIAAITCLPRSSQKKKKREEKNTKLVPTSRSKKRKEKNHVA
jgi:hypothetical protein